MNVRPLDLAQSDAEIAFHAPGTVPILDTPRAVSNDDLGVPPLGLMPLLALASAILATVVWNGFLLWEAAAFVFNWLGL